VLRFGSCQYLAELWMKDSNHVPPKTTIDLLKEHCICLCDDDNDIAMALACRHAFLPSVTSDSMRKVVQSNPNQCTVANGADHALQLALEFMSTPKKKTSPIRDEMFDTIGASRR
jgi:hypothetical protein